MSREIEILKKTRNFVLDQISDLTTQQLNEIPTGFNNNNIIWNIAHLLVSQQGLCYVRGNVPIVVDQKFYDDYKPGTKPDKFIDTAEIEKIKELFISVVDQLEMDLKNNLFTNYTPFTNRYGFEHRNINDSISFILYHEGLHLGVISSIKKTIKLEHIKSL